MDITHLLKYKRRHGELYNFLPENLGSVKQTDSETYSSRANEYALQHVLRMERPDFTKPLRELGKDGYFLEIAGGVSAHALNMMKDGYKVISSDIAEGMVKKAQEFAKRLNIARNGEFMVIDAENLPFKNESLSGIFMIASLHHVPNVKKALSEIRRCLKKGGCFLIGYEPAAWQYYAFYPFIKFFRYLIRRRNIGRPISIADDVTFGFSKRKLRTLLLEAGFENIKVTPTYYLYKTYKNYRILVSKLFKKEFREHAGIKRDLKDIDAVLAKRPLVKNLTWDWDAVAYKSQNSSANRTRF